jgi:osmotically-inducible protein OsmY
MEERIKQNVVEELTWDDRVDSSEVTVEVDGTTVRLGGSVSSFLARLAAAAAAWNVPEVASVENRIRVRYPADDAVPRDEEIRDHIRVAIGLNPGLAASNIEIGVERGEVTLGGTVDAFWKKELAEDQVSYVRGVTGIDNRLGITPTGKLNDHEIAKDVVRALERNAVVDRGEVDVEVRDGVVTLWGTVPNRLARRAAFDAAQYTRGVRDVLDRMVASGTGVP